MGSFVLRSVHARLPIFMLQLREDLYWPPQSGMTCNCKPPKVMIGTPYIPKVAPISDELQKQLKIQSATEKRAELCKAWGIDNKSHKQHGSNFSAPQSLVQLINNIVEPLQGADRERVRRLVVTQYSYDIDSAMMT
jgi:hypothetical protein